ncbi:hypothetical protein ACFSX9_09380 [Flavobacterium ardleyense]|uniref:Cell wall anchor protein n=1 Tax=Flavobacterium ardleyense TaxID=2038737 RepID=A0ABW5Z920_9FLAO
MKKVIPTLKISAWIAILLFSIQFSNAQVGINTTSPDASSMLDVTSTTKGMLTPRMTTLEKNAISSPANALLVYDTTLNAFSYYDLPTTKWVNMESGRNNFKRIKATDVLATVLADELAAGGGTKYLLQTNTLYEINGTVVVNLPIELNDAYVTGLDSGDDKLVKMSGDLFTGATGGSIRVLTLVSLGNVFNITGTGTQNLILRDCIIANSGNVGLVKNFSMVFLSIIQYVGNTNGVIYEDIGRLLLSNTGWFGGGPPLGNSGTYEKLVGTFDLVQKQGGFSEVYGTSIGFDVSSNPTINFDAVMESVVFSGTNIAGYVKPYTVGTYSGYNFNINWNVRCAGIPNETDSNAGGGFSMDYGVGTGISVSTNSSNPSNIVKVGTLATVSPASNLFRFSSDNPNRLRYLGKKKRIFQVSGSISVQVPNAATYIVYIAKNGSALSQYKVYGRGQTNGDILVLPLDGNIELNYNDFVEIFLQRYTGSLTDPIVANLTVIIK